MSLPREITVFTVGDSRKLSTWSNVPYFFTKSLEDKKIIIHRINIEENRVMAGLYKYSVYLLTKIFFRNSAHTYFRSGLNYLLTQRKIRKSMRRFRQSDAFIFLSYSFSVAQQTSAKVILFSDWSYLYKIRNFHGRQPYWFEKNAVRREQKHIDEADVVLSLFPGAATFTREHSANAHCYYLGNVINSENLVIRDQLVLLKLRSHKLVFIGNKKYLQGALDLIKAVMQLHGSGFRNIELHLIGLYQEDTGVVSDRIYYHGYLDKGYGDEYRKYYDLISEAKFIVNTTPGWGAFSAMTESMYYYTPVITTPYEEFVRTYGEAIGFGRYVPANSPDLLTTQLAEMLKLPAEDYVKMMEEAHDQVKDFTWSNYTQKLLDLLE